MSRIEVDPDKLVLCIGIMKTIRADMGDPQNMKFTINKNNSGSGVTLDALYGFANSTIKYHETVRKLIDTTIAYLEEVRKIEELDGNIASKAKAPFASDETKFVPKY